MVGNIFNFDWMTFLLVGVTIFLVAHNRAFSKKVRCEFYMALSACVIMSLLTQYMSLFGLQRGGTDYWVLVVIELICRPLVIFILISLFIKLKKDAIDYIFTAVLMMILLAAVATEILYSEINAVNSTMCVIVSLFYYYNVMQMYKKDNLTRLPLRHNLEFELSDINSKLYRVALIDVDDFKLINDKYGHDKGDEALVKVVKAIGKNLEKGCRLYRFGGDEFVIISRKVSEEEMVEFLANANRELSSDNLHFSYGIAIHNPGEDSGAVLKKADEEMYDHKKELKGDGIWDSLTGLLSYRGLIEEIDDFRRKAEHKNSNICLIAIDIERLNSINMAYGYVEGNYVIKCLSKILEDSMMNNGFVGRLGSDEFMAVIGVEDENDIFIREYINHVFSQVASFEDFLDKDYTVRLNIGKYFVTNDSRVPAEELVNNALYVKQQDKDNKSKNDYDDDNSDYDAQEDQIVKDILDNNKLKYAFQPIVSAKNGEIVAYESLMRSDTDVMVSPLTIIKYAELNKRTYDIEKYSFFNVLKHIKEEVDFPETAKIFINSIPGFMLTDDDYGELKSRFGDFFNRMVIEITEQREISDNSLATLNMRRSVDNYNLAIDDYGSGYSNTNSLLRYMPQVIKLDRLLITGIERNAKKQFFVNSIISFARENDMKILAEGVETESELKTVIRLGVDMIQGYFTAKPTFEVIESIPEEIKRIIVEEKLRVGDNKRKVYTAPNNCELSSVRLGMDDYTKLNVSADHITIRGNKDYTADLVIKIKDGVNCHMTLSNVQLNSVDNEPCIEIGEGANLTLNIEGNNSLNAKGIHVPDGSTLTVIGPGNLSIYSKGHECYGIGCDSESSFGKIDLRTSGKVSMTIDGENCVGIGGGIAGEKSSIDINTGSYDLRVAGVDAVGIGSYKGITSINLKDFVMNIEFRVNTGLVIGTIDGVQDVNITNFKLNILGSGTEVSGVGSIHETGGSVNISSGEYIIKLNGQRLFLVGADSGELNIKFSHVRVEMIGEGDNVLGFGTFDKKARLFIDQTSLDLVINASSPLGFGIVGDVSELGFSGALTKVKINGVTEIIGIDK